MNQTDRNLLLLIGVLSAVLPAVLVLGGLLSVPVVQDSLSAYYWTGAGGIFVSMLMFFSMYLFAYVGYDPIDNILTNIAAGLMFIVAVFPCEGGPGLYLFSMIPMKITGVIHYVAAAGVFSMLGVMSFFLFTRYDKILGMSTQKKKRNRIYRISGITIFILLGAGAILAVIPGGRKTTDPIRLWLIIESGILWSFSIAWLTKAGLIFREK